MSKDEDNRKKMFNFVKQLKDSARRNQLRNMPINNRSSDTPNESNTNQTTNNSNTGETKTNESTNQGKVSKRDSKTATNAESQSNDNNCSICLRENNEPALCNECFHCFCFPCIHQWSNQSNQCPVCRREYSSILYNIRSDTEYDELPVEPRRRTNEVQLILPFEFENLIETNFQNLGFHRINFPSPLNGNINTPFIENQPLAILPGSNDLYSFSFSNTQPDQNGYQRSIQRTIIISDPNLENQFIQTNMQTPTTSLERNNQLFYNPFLIPETTPSQQPRVVFNPNSFEPYRNLDNFFQSPTTGQSVNQSTRNRNQHNQQPQFENIDTFFDRILSDLTRMLPPTNNNSIRTQRQRTSFPFDTNRLNDFDNSLENLQNERTTNQTLSTDQSVLSRRGRSVRLKRNSELDQRPNPNTRDRLNRSRRAHDPNETQKERKRDGSSSRKRKK